MIKKLMSVAFVCILLSLLLLPAALADTVMYIYTENGKPLNVRSSEKVEENIIGHLDSGTKVTVRSVRSGWAEIIFLWDDPDGRQREYAYVQSRYLVKNLPYGSAEPNPSAAAVDANRVLTDMNNQFRSAKQVSPYTVTIRPARASGWVTMYWAPTIESQRLTICRQGKQLTVLTEMRGWFQVEDPETGVVGFISRRYATAQ